MTITEMNHWRAVCLETCTHGSEGGGWKRLAIDLASHLPYDVDGRKNGDRLPIMLSMTCLTGDWANPVLMTTDERMVLAPNGGAIASLSATGEGVNTAHAELLRGLLPHLFETGQAGGKIDRSLGAAHLAGLQRLVGNGLSRDLAYSFGILGDPDVALPFVASHSLFLPQVQR